MGLVARLNPTKREIPKSLRHPTLVALMNGKIGPAFPSKDEGALIGMRGTVQSATRSPIREPHKPILKQYTNVTFPDYRAKRKVRNKAAARSRRRNGN